MKKKSKVLLSIGLVIVIVFAFALVSFAEVDSDFDSSGNNTSYQADETYNISVCPEVCQFYLTGDTRYNRSIFIYNDMSSDFELTIRKVSGNYATSSYIVYDGDSAGSSVTLSINVDNSITLSPGDKVKLTIGNSYSSGPSGQVYAEHDKVRVSFSPDPQHIPGPIEVILNTVSGFFSSMLSAWTNLISMITSSWVFLVPVVMMVTVFMVVVIRKAVKGV